MQETGIVLSVHGKEAEVELTPASSCAGCALNSNCNPEKVQKPRITVTNSIHAGVGDWVKLEMNPGAPVASAFLIFAFSLFGLVLGYFAGHPFGALWEIIGAGSGFALFLGTIKLMHPILKKRRRFRPMVIQILSNAIPVDIEIKRNNSEKKRTAVED